MKVISTAMLKKKERGDFDTGAIGARAARVMKRSKHIQQRAETQLAEKKNY